MAVPSGPASLTKVLLFFCLLEPGCYFLCFLLQRAQMSLSSPAGTSALDRGTQASPQGRTGAAHFECLWCHQHFQFSPFNDCTVLFKFKLLFIENRKLLLNNH